MKKNKLTSEQIEYWNKITPFKRGKEGFYIVPPIPVCTEEDYNNIIVPNLIRCGAIPKDQLKVGTTYYGECRNANEAVWDGNSFIYQRYKFGYVFQEKINHFQDDDEFDLFIPIEEKK